MLVQRNTQRKPIYTRTHVLQRIGFPCVVALAGKHWNWPSWCALKVVVAPMRTVYLLPFHTINVPVRRSFKLTVKGSVESTAYHEKVAVVPRLSVTTPGIAAPAKERVRGHMM